MEVLENLGLHCTELLQVFDQITTRKSKHLNVEGYYQVEWSDLWLT